MTSLADQTRDLADAYADAGYVEMPDWLRALASIVDGDCPVCSTAMTGSVPIDGREVDRAPRSHFHIHLEATDGRYELCDCLIGQDHAQDPITEPTQPAAARQIVRDEATRASLDNP